MSSATPRAATSTSGAMGTDAVLELVQQVAEEVVLPRWRHLADAEIDQKSPGDYVTVADREAELRLTEEFARRAPGAVVVGEEASFADPTRMDAAATADWCLLVDPVDGTRNFVRGSADFAVMVAEVRSGVSTRSWIWQPVHQRAFVAERGAGATLNGVLMPRREGAPQRPPVGTSSQRRLQGFDGGGALAAVHHGSWCAGIDYPRVAMGEVDYLVYKNVKPWDHVPGQLLLAETGGTSRTWEGEQYTPGHRGPGLIAAGSAAIWDTLWSVWSDACI